MNVSPFRNIQSVPTPNLFEGALFGMNIPAGNTVYVDATLGNDATGQANSLSLPFKTLAAGVAAASSGTTVVVRPGNYTPSTNLWKLGVAFLYSPGSNVTYAPNNATVALYDQLGHVGTILVDGLANFTLSATGTQFTGKGLLLNASNLASFGFFRCEKITDTTGTSLSVAYDDSTFANFYFGVNQTNASFNIHGGAIVDIGVLKLAYGKIGSDDCALSGSSHIGYLDTTAVTNSDPTRSLVVGSSLVVDYFHYGTLVAHECTITIQETNKQVNNICQVIVTQGPTRIKGDLRSFSGPPEAAPLVIDSPDPVAYEGVIEMFNCDYSFPVYVKQNSALKIDRACLIQNLTGDGSLRDTIYGTTVAYGIYLKPPTTLDLTYRNASVSNAILDPTITSIGPALTVDAAVT